MCSLLDIIFITIVFTNVLSAVKPVVYFSANHSTDHQFGKLMFAQFSLKPPFADHHRIWRSPTTFRQALHPWLQTFDNSKTFHKFNLKNQLKLL